MAEALHVKKRDTRGKRNARRMRAGGNIPAVLYGHGGESISLTVVREEVASALRQGSRLFDLEGDVAESALVREVQWDTFGVDVLHVDFTRVSAGDRAEMTVAVELRGEAPGVREGGIVSHMLHEVVLDCLVTEIPEVLRVKINSLKLGETITAADMELPDGVNLASDPAAVVVVCAAPVVEEEPEEGEAGEGAEPEVIGRKAEEEDENKQ